MLSYLKLDPAKAALVPPFSIFFKGRLWTARGFVEAQVFKRMELFQLMAPPTRSSGLVR